MIASLIAGLIIAVFVAIFAFQNGEPVVVRFFKAELRVSLGLAIVLACAAGALAGFLLGLLYRPRQEASGAAAVLDSVDTRPAHSRAV